MYIFCLVSFNIKFVKFNGFVLCIYKPLILIALREYRRAPSFNDQEATEMW